MQVPEVLEQEEAPHWWAEQGNWEVVVEEEAEEARHLEAEEGAEGVAVQHSQVVAEVLVAKVQVQVGGEEEEGEGWLLVGVVQEGEAMPFADLVRGLPQTEVVHGCLCCHLGEKADLKRRYSAFWVLSGCFWLSCLHLHRV